MVWWNSEPIIFRSFLQIIYWPVKRQKNGCHLIEATLAALIELARRVVEVRELHHLDLVRFAVRQRVVAMRGRVWRGRGPRPHQGRDRWKLLVGSCLGYQRGRGRSHDRRHGWVALNPARKSGIGGRGTRRDPPRLPGDLHHPPEPRLLWSPHEEEDWQILEEEDSDPVWHRVSSGENVLKLFCP